MVSKSLLKACTSLNTSKSFCSSSLMNPFSPFSDAIVDNIFLLSATIVNSRLYCMIVEVDDTKAWKLESKELKRLRSSFTIDEVTA